MKGKENSRLKLVRRDSTKKQGAQTMRHTPSLALTVCSTLFLVACSSKQVDAAKADVERQLIDPSSAQYQDVQAFSEDVVCGNVNSKNRMGGYAGFKVFIYNGPRANTADLEVDQREIDLWCNNNPDKRKAAADDKSERWRRSGGH